jgi:hypothetical protein
VFSKSFTQPARFVESTCCLVLYLAEKRKTKKQSQKNYKEGGPCPRLKLESHSANSVSSSPFFKAVPAHLFHRLRQLLGIIRPPPVMIHCQRLITL